MANEVPESVSMPLPAPPPEPRERPSLVAGRGFPEPPRAAIGAPRNPLVPPEGSAEAHLDDAAREALSSAALEGALGLMTYGKAAARLGRTAAMQRSLARNPNYPRRELLRRTGYQRGLFGMGVETHGDASLKPSVLFRQGRVDGMLGELAYVHREVEAAYPGIRNMSVRIVPDAEWDAHVASLRGRLSEWSVGNTASGVHVRNGGGISIRGRKPGEPLDVYFSRMDSTLVHELQHVAQDLDGLRAPYPHPTREAYLADAREVEARNSATRRLFSGDERESMLRTATQDTPPGAVNLDDKGGDNYGTFRNFLASDDVPESIFGFPVVQREEDYTESDLEFFKENPKAAGFYDLGDDEMAEDVPQQAVGDGAGEVRRDPVPARSSRVKSWEVDPAANYGPRSDGTYKGSGWFGPLQVKGGGVATEYSISVGIDGETMLVPTLYPGMTEKQKRTMLDEVIPSGGPVPDDVVDGAVAFARARLDKGLSPFKNDGYSPRRAFATRWEQDMVVQRNKDGSVYVVPRRDSDGQYTVHGYLEYYSDRKGRRVPNKDEGAIPMWNWVRGADQKDAELTQLTDAVATRLALRPDGAAADVAWDILFNSKDPRNRLTRTADVRLYGTYGTLLQDRHYKDSAGTLAMLLESNSYGNNKNRSVARGQLILDELRRSDSQVLKDVVNAYDRGARGAKLSRGATADQVRHARHEAGLRAIRRSLGLPEQGGAR